MKLIVTKGATSQSVYLFIRDSSATTGVGLTGLAYNTSSLVAYYVRPLGNATSITLATQTVTGAWSSGGFVEVSSANMPGIYRFDVPDAVLATGVNWAVVMLKGATNMEPVPLEFELTSVDLQDTVRAGLTAMPNVASGSAGALLVAGSGTAALNVSSGNMAGSVASVTGAVGSVTSGVNAVQLAGQTITAAAGVTFPTSVASPTNITAGTITTVTNLTNAATSGDLTATMKTSVKTQAVDALATDTYPEIGQGTPLMQLSIQAKIGYLFKAWRNKTQQTATEYRLFNDDATNVDIKAGVSDDGTTLTRQEMTTGP